MPHNCIFITVGRKRISHPHSVINAKCHGKGTKGQNALIIHSKLPYRRIKWQTYIYAGTIIYIAFGKRT
jgi:hypothetical protein